MTLWPFSVPPDFDSQNTWPMYHPFHLLQLHLGKDYLIYHKELTKVESIPFIFVLLRFFLARAGDLAVRLSPRLEET